MKLHLNLSLRRALLAAMAAIATFAPSATAGVMHSDATYQTYTDFGQNRGRYVVGNKVNALLSHIRSEAGGITIDYTDGTDSFLISNEQGMISFNGTHDAGHSTVISPTFIATVLHNGSLDGSFSERTVGSNHAINYEAIDIRGSKNFRLAPDWGNGQYDYMLQRQSKVVTDVTWNQLTSLTYDQIENLDGGYIYHSGSGTMYQWNEENETMVYKAGPYTFIIGAINDIINGQVHGDGENISIHQNPEYIPNDGASLDNPLPNGIRPGDSGSPTFIYNSTTGKYEYIAAQQSAGAEAYGQARGNVEWTQETLKKFDANIDMSETSTIHLSAVDQVGETISETVGGIKYETTQYSGVATDADGNAVGSYIGVQTETGINTWTNLSGRKDINNWYGYENRDYTWGSPTYGEVISDLNVSDADLFYTQNLVFTPSQSTNNIILDATVDLGIGYAEFNKGANMDKAVFTITAATAGTMFNHAGYVINEGAEVHLQLTNPETYMTEWRKIGAGDLYIDGTGDTNALLNVGGSGKTYLNQTGGHAAYNVLVNSGATVVINGIGQIERDLTFGAGGGTLDLNGSGVYDDYNWWYNIDWYTTGGENRNGFTINALTEEAMITNSKNRVQLTYKQSGNTSYAGSFSDTKDSSLLVVYDGGSDSTWTLNSIHTDLTHNNSGFRVDSGKVILSGTNTVHGMGSTTATNANRLQLENDWHYADAAMAVEIASGATFELGSHARLTGQVVVDDGGTFIIREAVKHQYEYIEGGSSLENTYQYADYYGYKGIGSNYDIYLYGADAALKVEYSEGTTANTTIDASIYGKGKVSVDTGLSGGTLTLAGNNSSMSGTKTIVSGGLIADAANALGNTSTNKWKVQEKGWIVSHAHTGAELLSNVDSSSTGVLALSADTNEQLNLSGHKSLYVGAELGKTVEYGEKGTTTQLTAQDGAWRLGGGGGTLNVNFLLTGKNDLIIGNTYTSGTVHLANNSNTFSGDIIIMGTGNILTYASKAALGNAHVALSYGNTLALHSAGDLYLIKADEGNEIGAEGILAAVSSFDLDISNYSIALGAVGDMTYTGTLTIDADKGYHFGGSGNLTLDTALDGSDLMRLDGQGNSGSSVTLARANAYSGDIVAGGGLNLATPNSAGSIGIHAGDANTFASTNSMVLQQGAELYTDGHANMVVQNLTAQTDSSITNNGTTASSLELHVTQNTSIADGVLNDANNSAALALVKTGEGNLSMAGNKSWSGGLTIQEGQVTVNAGNGGVGSSANSIQIEDNGTLRVEAGKVAYGNIGQTIVNQTISGTGTIVAASGGNMLLTQQAAGFEGTVHVTEGTRLYVGKDLTYSQSSPNAYNNVQAFDNATIKVDSGSQVRITNNFVHVSQVAVVSHADYTIAGSGLAAATSTALVHESLIQGALSIDCGATITGNVTLAENATIASWSKNPTTGVYRPSRPDIFGRYYSIDNGTAELSAHYGVEEYLGGTIRGQILGAGKDLTIAGSEGMTFTADSANTYGNLIIANANGNNTDKFALRLDGGKAVSQTSSALGTGSVTLGDGLIMRLAGTGEENQSHIEYIYANNIAAGNGSTIQSYNITNKLMGTITMGEVLNLSTANGGVLELAGNIAGNGKLSIGADSSVVLSGSQAFGGSVAADAGASLTLASSTVLSAATPITGTSTLNLNLTGVSDFTLGDITVENSNSTLNLRFDFTGTPSADNADSWSTLTGSIAADSTVIGLELNMFDDLRSGDYLLISQAGNATDYSLADTMGGRLSLTTDETGALVLQVGADERLYWSGKQSSNWNTDTNWVSEKNGDSAYKTGAYVMLDFSEVDTAAERENIVLGRGETTVSTLAAQKSSYEISGEGRLTGEQLIVGNKGDLKLSNTGGSSFSNGVVVNDASLEVSGGNLTAVVRAENGASFSYSGGTLTGNLSVTDASATIRNATLAGNVAAAGSGSLTLSSVQMSGNRQIQFETGSISVSGGTTLSGEFTHTSGQNTLQVSNMAFNDGDVTTDSAISVDSLDMQRAELTLNHAKGTTTSFGNITGDGSLYKNSAGDLKLTNANLREFALKGGGITTIDGTVTASQYLSIGKETLNLESGASLTVPRLTAGNTANGETSTININGGTLTITGNSNNKDTEASLLLAHWQQAPSVLNLNAGSLSATDAIMYTSWGTGGKFVATGGTATLKGINVEGQLHERGGSFVLGSADAGSARVNIGSSGIAGIVGAASVILGNGTIAARADFAINGSKAVNLIGTSTGTTFDTDGHTITVNTGIAGAGNLIKTGAGVLSLAGSGAEFSGNISVTEGALALNATSKDIFAAASSVTIGNATLDLSAIDFSDSANAISLSNTMSLDETSTVAFGTLESGVNYQIFSFSGGTAEGWYNLGLSNFTINGVSLADMEHASLSLGMDGSFSYSMGWELTWNGSTPGIWTTASGNEVWLNSDSSAAGFCNGDSVTFESDATVTLGSDIMVSAMHVNSGTVVVNDSGNYAFNAGSVNVADDAALQIQYTNNNAAANNTLTKLILGNGASFSTYDGNAAIAATTIGQLQLNGASATVKDENNSGIYHIQNLSLKDGLASSLLNLVKQSQSKNVTVFQLGSNSDAGNFAGTINLKSTATDSYAYGRPAAIILSNKDIAANAVINLESNTSSASGSVLALGINADNTTIAGLESGKNLGVRAKLFSGSIGTTTSEEWATGNIDNASTRTLTINTAEGGNHTFYGEVMSISSNKLNLVKNGKGTQSFLGSGSFGSITVEGGTLTLGGSMTVEVSSNANRIFDIAANARLNISSSATFENTSNVNLEKTGAGTMTVNSKISQNWLDIRTGTFEVAYTGDDGNSIDHIDAGMGGAATGQVLVKKGAKLTSTAIWMKNGSIALEEGGKLIYKGATIIGESSSGTAIIERTNKASGGSYSGVDDSNITISNARVKYTAGSATINNKLINSSVENAGGGVLTVTNTGNTISGVVASAGDVTLQNLAANTSLNLLEIATGCTVNAYVGTQETDKRTITVSSTGTALLSGGATLNTSLTLADGATLEMYNLTDDAAVTINGALTFNSQVKLGTKLLAAVDALTSWEESLTLFTGLAGGVSLPAATAANADEMVRASEVFSNVTNGNLYVSYQVIDNVGSLMVINVPEPTTTTLSLLALSALAARRRRKN